jgi:hypothetical protein
MNQFGEREIEVGVSSDRKKKLGKS